MGLGVGNLEKPLDPAVFANDDPNPLRFDGAVGTPKSALEQRWIDVHPELFAAEKATLKELHPELTDEAIDGAARELLGQALFDELPFDEQGKVTVGVFTLPTGADLAPRLETLAKAWSSPEITKDASDAGAPGGAALPEPVTPRAKPSLASAKMGAAVQGIKDGDDDAKAAFLVMLGECPDAPARKQLFSVAIAQAEAKGLPLEQLMALVPEEQAQEFADTCTAMNKPAPSVYEKTLGVLAEQLGKDKATLDQYGITPEDLVAWRRTGVPPPGYQALIETYEKDGAHMLFGPAYLLKRYGEFANKERLLQKDVTPEDAKAIDKALQADESRITKTWSRVNNAAMGEVIGSADAANKKVQNLQGELAKIDPNDPARVAKTLELEQAKADFEKKTGIASKVTEAMKDVGLKQIAAAGGEEKASPELKKATARNMGKFAVQQANMGEIKFNKLGPDDKMVAANIPIETTLAPVLITNAQQLNPEWREDQGMIDDANASLGTCYGVWSQPVGRLIVDATDDDKTITINATDGAVLVQGRQVVRGQLTDVAKADRDLNKEQKTPEQKKHFRDADTRLSQLDGEAATETMLGAGAQKAVDSKEAIYQNYQESWGEFDMKAEELRAKIADSKTSAEDRKQAEYDLATLEQGDLGDLPPLGSLLQKRDELEAKLARARSAKAEREAEAKAPKVHEPMGDGGRAAQAGKSMARGGSDQEIANIQKDLDEVKSQIGEPEAARQRNLRAHHDAQDKFNAVGDGTANKTEGFLITLGGSALQQDHPGKVQQTPTAQDLVTGSFNLRNKSVTYNSEVQQSYEGTTNAEKFEGDRRQEVFLVSMGNWNDLAKEQQAKIKEANIEIATNLTNDYKTQKSIAEGPYVSDNDRKQAKDKMAQIKSTLWDMGLEVGGANGGRDPLTTEGMADWQKNWGAGTIDFQVWVNKDTHDNLQKRADNVDDAKAQLPGMQKQLKKEEWQQANEDVGHMALDVGKRAATIDKRIAAHMIDDAGSLQLNVKDPLAYGQEVGRAAVGILKDAQNGVGGTVEDAAFMGDLRTSVEGATKLYGAEASAKELDDLDKDDAFINALINPAIQEFQEGGEQAKAAVNGDVNEDYKGRKSLGLCAGFVFGWVGEAINSNTEKGEAARIIDDATDGAVQGLTDFKTRYAGLSKGDKLIVLATLRSDGSTEAKAKALGKILGNDELGATVAVLAGGSTVMQTYQAGYVRGTDGVTHQVPGIVTEAAVAIGDIDTGPLKYAERGEAPDARQERDHQELKKTVNLNYCNDPMVQFMWSRFDDVVLFVATGGLALEAAEGVEMIEGVEAGLEIAKGAEKGLSWVGKITKTVGKAEAWLAKSPVLNAVVRKGGELVFSVAHQEIMQGVGKLVHSAGVGAFGSDSFGSWLMDAGLQVGMAKMGGKPTQLDLIENMAWGGTQQGVELFVLPRIFTNKKDLEEATAILNQVFIGAQSAHGMLKGRTERRFMEGGAKAESQQFTKRANEMGEHAGVKLPSDFEAKYRKAAETYNASLSGSGDMRESYKTFRSDVVAAAGSDPKAQAIVKNLVSVDQVKSAAAVGGLDKINWAENPPDEATLKKAINASADDMVKTGAAGSRDEALLMAQRYCAGRISEAGQGVTDKLVLERLGKQSAAIGEITRVETKAPSSVSADATASNIANGVVSGLGLQGPEADAMKADLQKRISAFEQQPLTPENANAYLEGLRSAFPDHPNVGNAIVQIESMRVAKNLTGERPAGSADPKQVNDYLSRLDGNLKVLGAGDELRSQTLGEARKTLVFERAAPALQGADPKAQRAAIEQAMSDFGGSANEGRALANDAVASSTAYRLAQAGGEVTPAALEKAVLDDLTASGLEGADGLAYIASKKGEANEARADSTPAGAATKPADEPAKVAKPAERNATARSDGLPPAQVHAKPALVTEPPAVTQAKITDPAALQLRAVSEGNLESTPAFAKLPDETKTQVRDAIAQLGTDQDSRDLIAKMATMPGFAALDSESQKRLLLMAGLTDERFGPTARNWIRTVVGDALLGKPQVGIPERLRVILDPASLGDHVSDVAPATVTVGAPTSVVSKTVPDVAFPPADRKESAVVTTVRFDDGSAIDVILPAGSHAAKLMQPEEVIELVRYLSPEQRKLTKAVFVCPQDSDNTYMAATRGGLIAIYPKASRDQDSRMLIGTLKHEVGHLESDLAFGWIHANTPAWDIYKQALAADGIKLSKYGTQAEHEDFAESYALYQQVVGTPHYERFAAIYPHRFEVFDAMRAHGRSEPLRAFLPNIAGDRVVDNVRSVEEYRVLGDASAALGDERLGWQHVQSLRAAKEELAVATRGKNQTGIDEANEKISRLEAVRTAGSPEEAQRLQTEYWDDVMPDTPRAAPPPAASVPVQAKAPSASSGPLRAFGKLDTPEKIQAFRGPPPDYSRPPADQVSAIITKANSGAPLEPNEARILMQEVLYGSRYAVWQSSMKYGAVPQQDVFSPETAAGWCGPGQAAAMQYVSKLIPGAKLYPHQAALTFETNTPHGFLVVELPDGQKFLIDPTVSQFYDPAKPAGAVGMRTPADGLPIMDQLKRAGFLPLTDNIARVYGETIGGKPGMTANDFIPNAQGKPPIHPPDDVLQREMGAQLPPPPVASAPNDVELTPVSKFDIITQIEKLPEAKQKEFTQVLAKTPDEGLAALDAQLKALLARSPSTDATKRHVHEGGITNDPRSAYNGKWDGTGVHDWNALVTVCKRDGFKIVAATEDPITHARYVTIERSGKAPHEKNTVTRTDEKSVYPAAMSPADIDAAGDAAFASALSGAPGTKLSPPGTNDGRFTATVKVGNPAVDMVVTGWYKLDANGEPEIISHYPQRGKWPSVPLEKL